MACITERTQTITDSENRFMKCVFVVLKIFPQIMQRIMGKSSMPAKVLHECIQNDMFFKEKLTQDDDQVINTLLSDGYTKLDFRLMFKIITHYSNLFFNKPTSGWGSRPNPEDITIGDDAQRLKLKRNHFMRQVNPQLSEEDCDGFFSEATVISERIDKFLSCTEEDSFKLKIETLKLQAFVATDDLKLQYDQEKDLEVSELFKEKIGDHEFIFYEEISLKELKENRQNHPSERSLAMTITVLEVNDPEITQKMNNRREEINEGLHNIKVVSFSNGSLVMNIVVQTSTLLNDDDLESELKTLFTRILTMSKYEDIWKSLPTMTIVMSESLLCFDDDQSEVMGDKTTEYSKGSLQLNLRVDNNILQSDDLLKSEIKTLFHIIVSKSTENTVFSTDKPVVSVIEPCFGDSSQGSLYSYQPRTDSDKLLVDHNRDVPIKVESINLQLLNRSEVQVGRTRPRCCTLPNGLLVITSDVDGSLLIMQTDRSIQSKIKHPLNKDDMTFTDITAMTGSYIAVSTLNPPEILIIDVTKEDVVYGFKTEYMPTSITFKDRYCLYCAPGKGIIKLDIEDYFKYSDERQYLHGHGTFSYSPAEEKIVHNDMNIDMNSKIASNNDRICYSDYYFMVTVLDSKYEVIYKCDKLKRHPTEITIDHYGVVYVIIERNITVIIHDGKTVRNILGKDDGLIRPSGLHYDRYTQQLIITDDDSVLRYSIKAS